MWNSILISLMLSPSYHLARYPEVLARLNSEIASTVGDRTQLNQEDFKKMPYLSNVLKESGFPGVTRVIVGANKTFSKSLASIPTCPRQYQDGRENDIFAQRRWT